MTKRLLLAFLVLALTVACAKTYWVTFYVPSAVAGVELKPGEYRLDLNGSQVTLKNGRLVAESAVKIEENGEKYKRTTVRCVNGDSGCQVQEIRLGGTNTKLVFD
jgi:hypothetical protein